MTHLVPKRPVKCIIERIWPKREPCPWSEWVNEMPVTATKANTGDISGSYVSE